ncbi:hypothetical protein BC830DRAFT_1224865 [Chytriomyces sp. MP71]|nr:hypothetical protein BC830DRAFT_1224865 [Chytriomyces sp. MP71]
MPSIVPRMSFQTSSISAVHSVTKVITHCDKQKHSRQDTLSVLDASNNSSHCTLNLVRQKRPALSLRIAIPVKPFHTTSVAEEETVKFQRESAVKASTFRKSIDVSIAIPRRLETGDTPMHPVPAPGSMSLLRRRSSLVAPALQLDVVNKNLTLLDSIASDSPRPDSPAVISFNRGKKFRPSLQIVIPENGQDLGPAAPQSAAASRIADLNGLAPLPEANSSHRNALGAQSGSRPRSFRKPVDMPIAIPRRLGGGYSFF